MLRGGVMPSRNFLLGPGDRKQRRTRFARFPHLPKSGRAFDFAQARLWGTQSGIRG
jgi:hypothetical protein